MQNYLEIIQNEYVFGFLVTFCLAILFFIDTSCWCLRGLSPRNKIGLYTSKTNIYSYFGRLFTFTYMSIMSIRIDVGLSVESVTLYVCIGFFVGAIVQAATLNSGYLSHKILATLARFLRVELEVRSEAPSRGGIVQTPLFVSTFIATTLFCAGLGAPYILAAALPEYRLTMSSLGQVLNAFGMIFILIYVDQRLYRAWDNGTLGAAIYSYRWGRVSGILFSATVMLVLFEILRS
jgi:hypothetical protein